ncbi:MAG: hypothetical protein GY845_30200 [Planctomycetes bacterium]|nr:hypothetical protein [Planctomycetota bacterium]
MKTITPALEQRIERSSHRFESKEETAIADMLQSYGIPFFYKQPTLVNENGQKTIEYVDFFLPTYNGLAVDYVTDTKSKINTHKEQIYSQNRISAVLVTQRDLYNKNWQNTLYKKLEQIYHKRPVYNSSGSCK